MLSVKQEGIKFHFSKFLVKLPGYLTKTLPALQKVNKQEADKTEQSEMEMNRMSLITMKRLGWIDR